MAGHSAFGTLLGVATSVNTLDLTTNPSSWTYIGNLTGIGGPSLSMDTIDVTAHDSPDGFREYVAGVIDGGDISLEGNLVDSGSGEELTDLIDTREVIGFCVRFASSATSTDALNYDTWLFTGAMVGFETDAPFDDKIGFSASIKVSGKPYLTGAYATG